MLPTSSLYSEDDPVLLQILQQLTIRIMSLCLMGDSSLYAEEDCIVFMP